MTRAATALTWVGSRLITLVLLFGLEGARGVAGDITYFAAALHDVPDAGLAHTLVEYPLPAVAVVALPMGLAVLLGSSGLYAVFLVLSALVVDGAFTAVLHGASRGARRPLVVWLLAAPLLGGLALARFDLLVGVLAALGLLVAAPRPRLAAMLVSLATALKLWPVLLLPGLVASSRRRTRSVLVMVATGGLLAAAAVLAAGWGRLVSPLTYQGDRGLHVESVLATPAMVGWAVDPGAWTVGYADSRSFEVTGPGTGTLLLFSTLLTSGAVACLLVLIVRAFRAGGIGPDALVWLSLTAVTAFVVTAKVFSPQYLLWLLPIGAVALVLVRQRTLEKWTTVLLTCTALTHVMYPLGYRGLVEHGALTGIAVPVLAVRNLLLVGLLVVAVREAWRATGHEPHGSDEPTVADEPATR